MTDETTDRGTNPTIDALTRHFVDLREGTHGDAVSRGDKERLFERAVELLDPYARQVLGEVDEALLLGTGEIEAAVVVRGLDGGVVAGWRLSWPEQREAGVPPVTLEPHYERGFHHPHLRGATVGEWPLNVFDDAQAAAEVPTLRAIAAADLHNLVFRADYGIVPAINRRT